MYYRNSSLVLKVREGTRSDGKRLCDSCHHSQIIRGAAESQEMVICNRMTEGAAAVPFRVVECNQYSDKNMPSLHSMGSIAWVLMTDTNRRKIGFVSPKQWSEKNPHSNPTDDIDE